MVRVVIVQKQRLLREALAFALAGQPGIEVSDVSPDVPSLRDHLADLDPSIFLVHLYLPERRGLAEAREISIACPRSVVLMLGLSDLETDVIAACESGATGYLPDDASLEELLRYVRAAAAGEVPCSPRVAYLLFARLRDRTRELRLLQTAGAPRLTRREIEIIGLIEQRLSNKEIAVRLDIEVQTVKNHVHNILEKLELGGRHAAVQYARERGLIPLLPVAPPSTARLLPHRARVTPA